VRYKRKKDRGFEMGTRDGYSSSSNNGLVYNILIAPLLMINLTYSIYVAFTALSIGLVCVIFKLKFVVNSRHLFFDDITLKYFSSFACEMGSL